jgi:hypothetical protein
MYQQQELPIDKPLSDVEFVTKEEFNASLEEIKKLISQNSIVNNF